MEAVTIRAQAMQLDFMVISCWLLDPIWGWISDSISGMWETGRNETKKKKRNETKREHVEGGEKPFQRLGRGRSPEPPDHETRFMAFAVTTERKTTTTTKRRQ